MNSVNFFPFSTVASGVERVPVVLQVLDGNVSWDWRWSLSGAIHDEARNIGRRLKDGVFDGELQRNRR